MSNNPRVVAHTIQPKSTSEVEGIQRPHRPLSFDLIKTENTGASSVEFALLAGLLFAIIFATIEFGVWGMNKTVIAGAARDAVVQFAQTQSADQGTKRALTAAKGLSTTLLASEVSFFLGTSTTAAASTATCTPGQLITVKISHPYVLISGSLVTNLIGKTSLAMSAESASVCE